jgi:GH15 family glucan-1,4-alpha-glucosidase
VIVGIFGVAEASDGGHGWEEFKGGVNDVKQQDGVHYRSIGMLRALKEKNTGAVVARIRLDVQTLEHN